MYGHLHVMLKEIIREKMEGNSEFDLSRDFKKLFESYSFTDLNYQKKLANFMVDKIISYEYLVESVLSALEDTVLLSNKILSEEGIAEEFGDFITPNSDYYANLVLLNSSEIGVFVIRSLYQQNKIPSSSIYYNNMRKVIPLKDYGRFSKGPIVYEWLIMDIYYCLFDKIESYLEETKNLSLQEKLVLAVKNPHWFNRYLPDSYWY